MILTVQQKQNLKFLRNTERWTQLIELASPRGLVAMAENGLVDIRVVITDMGLKAIEPSKE